MKRILAVLLSGLVSVLGAQYIPSGGGGGTTVTAAAPYISIGGVKYVGDTLFPYTALFSGSFLDANTSTITALPNGESQVSFAAGSALNSWYGTTATATVECELRALTNSANDVYAGCWICDTTNGFIYVLDANNASGITVYVTARYSAASCAGTPGSAANTVTYRTATASTYHIRLTVISGTLHLQASQSSGDGFQDLTTVGSIGTIAKGGIDIRTAASTTTVATYLSVKVT